MAEQPRRPTGLLRQLTCLWDDVAMLKSEVQPVQQNGDAPADPGDLTVYFENGLTG